MNNDALGNRMKNNYEDRYRFFLTRRTPVIMRLDGKAFHTLTRGCVRPYDKVLSTSMINTASVLLKEIQGAKCAYVQSDEINILITDFDKLETDAWFDYNIQKMTSISASLASIIFYSNYRKTGLFDCRVFNIPKEEVINYFRWRYKDWVRNSIQMLAQSLYSSKELHGKNKDDMCNMCIKKGKDWNDIDDRFKNGVMLLGNDILFNFNLMNNNDITNIEINKYLKGE